MININGCANIQPPSGGPKDEVPPFVAEYYPKNRTTNAKVESINLEFSEWVNRSSLIQNLNISPPMKYTTKWSGKELKVKFEEELKANTTYLFSIGTDYTDNNGIKPDSSFSITFSTGNAIDTGMIEVELLGEKISSTYIYGYRIDNKNPDTINPETLPAEFKTQIGNNGRFSMQALPEGKFRIFAIQTQFKDNLYHKASDKYGVLSKDIEVIEGKSEYIIFKLIDSLTRKISKLDSAIIDTNLKELSVKDSLGTDSTKVDKIKIEDTSDYPRISGKLLNETECKNIIILFKSSSNKIYSVKVEDDSWQIQKIKPGNYKVEMFCDENQNGEYDYGSIIPFKFSEKFIRNVNEIEVKPRWEIENIMLLYK
jgi:hypothetical protein